MSLTTKTLAESIREAVALQLRKADMPKYQLERAIDPFLGPFLEEFLSIHYKVPASLLCAEFPIRKSSVGDDDTLQTTNVDYAYLLPVQDNPTAVFVELKTDPVSMRDEQLDRYYRMLNLRFADLIDGVYKLKGKTRRWDKYKVLLDEVDKSLAEKSLEYAHIVKLEMIYLTPFPDKTTKKNGTHISWISFDSFIKTLDGKTMHPEFWSVVSPLFKLIAKRGKQ